MKTALFLGRFQPPHVGHLLTIRKLAERYAKVIIGVTEALPTVMPRATVLTLLKQLLPESAIEVIPVDGSVEDGTAVIDCDFDICCSGNPKVLERMHSWGYETEYVERSTDSLYSGTRERQVYIDKAIAAAGSRSSRPLVQFDIVATSSLRPIEKINPTHYAAIERDILESGVMRMPVIVDRQSRAVLDGSHRFAFLLRHGCRYSPALLCDYDDESIFVGNHLIHRFAFDEGKWLTKQHVRATAISGKLYDPRTTRHFFPFRKVDHPTELRRLDPTELRSIDHLVHSTTKAQEIRRNEEYISELMMELAVLDAYRQEQVSVLNWLYSQNDEIRASERVETVASFRRDAA